MNLYAVVNRDGQYFRRKGYGGYGVTWVESLENATLYSNISTARSRVGYFTRNWPEFGVPQIVEYALSEVRRIDETERATKAAETANRREKERKRRRDEWRAAEPR